MNLDLQRLCMVASLADGERNWPFSAYEEIVRAIVEELPNVEGGKRYSAGGWSRATANQLALDILDDSSSS